MEVNSSTLLKFSSVAEVLHIHWISFVHYYFIQKCFQSVMDVSSCRHNIVSYEFMERFSQIFFNELHYWLPISIICPHFNDWLLIFGVFIRFFTLSCADQRWETNFAEI